MRSERQEQETGIPHSSPLTPHGVLYIVATPIGNLEDMTFRAVRILKEVDLIAAEDTRHSRKLLTHFGIAKPLTSFFDHNEAVKTEYILDCLRGGNSVALISDAGTPCISDPGYKLVQAAISENVRVVPIPGPSALLAALAGAGLPTDSFAFVGFLPNRPGKRREKLVQLAGERRLLVFYESPLRLSATLTDMHEVFGDRDTVVARELTKLHEEFIRGGLGEVREQFLARQAKGEVVILVAPARKPPESSRQDSATERLRNLLAENRTLKDAVRLVAAETGLPRSAVYAEALRLKS